MIRFLLRRFLTAVGILFVISIVAYGLLNLALDPLADLRESGAAQRRRLSEIRAREHVGAAGWAGAVAGSVGFCGMSAVAPTGWVWAAGAWPVVGPVVAWPTTGEPVVPAAFCAAVPPVGAAPGGVMEPPLEATQRSNSAWVTTLICRGMKA